MVGTYVAVAVGAYLLGSIPTGYLVARARGVDIRKHGSGNIGATNAFRVLGRAAGTVVLVTDALKGFVAVKFLAPSIHEYFGAQRADLDIAILVAGVAAVLGHTCTLWLKFKGGKGVATTAGVLAAWNLVGFGATLAVWILVARFSRYVSLASICAALALPPAFYFSRAPVLFVVVACVLSALVIFKHRANIQRLRQGTEPKIGERPAGVRA